MEENNRGIAYKAINKGDYDRGLYEATLIVPEDRTDTTQPQ